MSKTKPTQASTGIPYTRKELHDPAVPGYTGEALKMISFPLGGIGTGTIGLGGRGELRDWEIFNNPRLGYRPDYTMPLVFAKWAGGKVAKVLERKLLPPHHDSHGLRPQHLAGLPRLAEALFVGTYPVARIVFQDDELPVEISLEAFSPMIPTNADDSAIPAAILTYRLTNRTRKSVRGSVAIAMANTVGLSACDGRLGGNVNAFRKGKGLCGIHMTSRQHPRGQVGHGSEVLATTARRVSYLTDFDEPGWFDKGQKVWDGYSATGRPPGPTTRTRPSADGATRIGMLAAHYNLQAGGSTEITFIIAWSFPVRLMESRLSDDAPRPIRNHYARRFDDAWKAASYVAEHFDRLRAGTVRFEQALFSSTLPGDVLDAASANMSIIRTNTTMWLDSPAGQRSGRIHAYEGCNTTTGCCPMNCTHVWNYEQSMAHLYPDLERSMRLTDFQDNLHDKGAMSFRTNLPLGEGLGLWRKELPAADGQFGTVVKVYREWRISGDTRWLKRLWPGVKASIEFAWKGFAGWDADKDGLMEGVQHNTYDIEFHGPNSMCGSLYLAALAAGAQMADAVGEGETAEEFRQLAAKGAKRHEQRLFNGEFYVQRVPVGARPKYQYGYGCLSDQLLGQWAAHVAGLGYVLPAESVKKAVEAVFRHNFRADLSGHECCQRVYAVGEEAGLVLCTWPNGRRERFPFPYSDEVWTGIEYQVAAHLIYEGLVDEGLAVVRAVRARHDGIARNPWNEFECGDHYARAMASWSLLLALSGQCYDGRSARLTVRPVVNADDFRCIVTASAGYGAFSQQRTAGALSATLGCLEGRIGVSELAVGRPGGRRGGAIRAACRLNGKAVASEASPDGDGVLVRLAERIRLEAGDRLTCRITQ